MKYSVNENEDDNQQTRNVIIFNQSITTIALNKYRTKGEEKNACWHQGLRGC